MAVGEGKTWLLATMLACAFFYLMIHRSERVGLIIFSDKIDAWYAPRTGRTQFKRCLNKLCETPRDEGGASCPEVCIPRVGRQNSIILISDFLRLDAMTEGLDKILRFVGELHAVQVSSEVKDWGMPDIVSVLRDVESGEELDVGLIDAVAKERTARNIRVLEERLEQHCRRRRIPFTRCLTEESLRVQVLQHLSRVIASYA
jgi:uncharacterized protein (DUF58 family)